MSAKKGNIFWPMPIGPNRIFFAKVGAVFAEKIEFFLHRIFAKVGSKSNFFCIEKIIESR